MYVQSNHKKWTSERERKSVTLGGQLDRSVNTISTRKL